ncbi:MAG: histidinol-phosphatase [Bacteroidales bacterium]
MKCNYHTHSTYCDGKEPLSAFVEQAIKLDFNHLGFSSHAPIPNENDFAIKEEEIPTYLNEIQQLKAQNLPLTLFAGLECDFIPTISIPFKHFKEEYQLDYMIGGVHLVKSPLHNELWFIDGSKRETYDRGLDELFHRNIQKAVTTFWEQSFEMLETEQFDIIAHLDKIKMHNQDRFFTQQESWYLDLVDYALYLIKKHDVIIEMNSRGLYKSRCNSFYPSDYIIQKAKKLSIPFIISSDAHQSEELNLYYEEAIAKLKSFGIDELVALREGKWKEYTI